MTYTKGQVLLCPYCSKSDSNEPVEDFVVHNRISVKNKHQCGWCDKWFYVTESSENVFEVTK